MMTDEIDPDMTFEEDLLGEVPDMCLCGRDPASAGVQLDLAKALVLRWQYGIFMEGCLSEIADVFDKLMADLRPKVAREMKQIVREVNKGLTAFAAELRAQEQPGSGRTWTR